MVGWEFPPFMAGGLGVHCLELTTQLARMGTAIDFYMPHMTSIEGPLKVADHHRHLNIIEVEADAGVGPYAGSSRAYDENFNAAVNAYNARVVAEFRSHDADVLHCHDWITAQAGLELRRRTGIPLVFTVHSTEYDRSAGFYPQQWIADIERRAVNEADVVIAVSKYTADQLVERYGAPRERVFPVHNGVDFSKYPSAVERDYGRSNETVLYLSRVSRQKGPMFFMQAARQVVRSRPEARFILAGKGEMLRECVDFAVDNRLMGNVSFAGFVPDEDVPRFYANSDVYVLPSVSEPFGISILEAMSSGVPTIVSKTTGVGEALRNVLKADFWDTHEMADMILRLLDSKPLREELGRNGALEVKKFTWEACGRKTRHAYDEALERAPKSRRLITA